MNPTNPPIPTYPGRRLSNGTNPISLYGAHINAVGGYGGSGPSARTTPRSKSSPTSLYPSHLAQHSRALPLPSGQPSRGGGGLSLPPSLIPGSSLHPKSGFLGSLENRLFFQSGPTSSVVTPVISTASSHPFAQSTSLSPRPALPPKPRIKTYVSTGPFAEHTPPTIAPPIPPKSFLQPRPAPTQVINVESPSSPDSDELVTRALELSLQDPVPVVRNESDDDILARVLAESLVISSPMAAQNIPTSYVPLSSSPRQIGTESLAGPPSASSCPSSSSLPSSPGFSGTPTSSAHSNVVSDVDHFTIGRAQISIGVDLEPRMTGQTLLEAEDEARRKQVVTDEEFARSIALSQFHSAPPSPMYSQNPPSINVGTRPLPPTGKISHPPLYEEALKAGTRSLHNPPSPSMTPVAPGPRPLPPPKDGPSLGRGSVSCNAYSAPAIPTRDRPGRSNSAQTPISCALDSPGPSGATDEWLPPIVSVGTRPVTIYAVQQSQNLPEEYPIQRLKLSLNRLTSASGSALMPTQPNEELTDEINDSISGTSSPLTANPPGEGSMISSDSQLSAPVVDEELLLGVSFGFHAPPMPQTLLPMEGPIPNIITLPYGRSPPLHIQAPSWRHLLKLLTRLSDSRIEPTVEAFAGAKSELRLRTVVQFMKVHHTSNDWRTMVYLTIDVPIPIQTQNIHKYTNGDVNVFPYSYTISPLPALLRAGAGQSNISKCFTVPATTTIPYPTLPISFPAFAMYLHAVLEASRRAANDSSGGLRKLAKIVDTLYPAAPEIEEVLGPEFNGPDRRGVGGFFRRALGRGDRGNHNQRGGNADTYEFITPFRVDEYR